MNVTKILQELLLTMSQKMIAEAIGMSQSSVSKALHGKQVINHVAANKLEKLALSKGVFKL